MQIKKFNTSFEITKQVDESGVVEGYGSVFGNTDLDGDIVDKSAFDSFIERSDTEVPMLFGHNTNDPIGIWKEFSVDERGLFARGQLAVKTTRGSDVREFLKQGIVKGLSIGAKVTDFVKMDTGGVLYKGLDLRELSVVLFPANPAAGISTVKNEKGDIILKEVLMVLRNAGMSKSEAEAFVAKGKHGIPALRNEEGIAQSVLKTLQSFKAEV